MTRLLSISVLLLFFSIATIAFGKQDGRTVSDQRLEAALRSVGNHMLNLQGDSTSRVLPIEQDGMEYSIRFENELEIVPMQLVLSADSILRSAGLQSNYLLEIEECGTGDIFYSIAWSDTLQIDQIPCGVRIPPKGCYIINFNFSNELEDPFVIRNEEESAATKETDRSPGSSSWWYMMLPIFVVIALLIYKRKNNTGSSPFHISLGKYVYDKKNMELVLKEERIQLTAKESDLLLILYQNVNETVERDVLLKEVWDDEGDYIGRTLDVYISKLRKKLEADPSIKIMNIRGVGYKLILNDEAS